MGGFSLVSTVLGMSAYTLSPDSIMATGTLLTPGDFGDLLYSVPCLLFLFRKARFVTLLVILQQRLAFQALQCCTV